MKNFLPLILFVSLIFCQGCLQTRKSSFKATGPNDPGTAESPKSDPDPSQIDSGVNASAISYSRNPLNFMQILDSLITMAGITDPNQIIEINKEWALQKAQFPKTGNVSEVTPNTMNAAFFLASKVCDFVKSAPGLPTNTAESSATSSPNEITAVTNASNFFSQKFMGRNLSSDEVAPFLTLKKTAGLSTSSLHHMVCTIVASSAESLSN